MTPSGHRISCALIMLVTSLVVLLASVFAFAGLGANAPIVQKALVLLPAAALAIFWLKISKAVESLMLRMVRCPRCSDRVHNRKFRRGIKRYNKYTCESCPWSETKITSAGVDMSGLGG